MKLIRTGPLVVCAVAVLAAASGVAARAAGDDKAPAVGARPALSVTVVTPSRTSLPWRIAANGSVAAWQEASVGTEAQGLRLAEVRVNVGDVVRRGQVLATFASETIGAEAAMARAALAEAEAALAEAQANADRARELQGSGALSAQQIATYLTAERTAAARVERERAAAKLQQLRLAQTAVLAPDDGVISARSATVGAVAPPGSELFRLIRGGRLEWRAEVPAGELARVQPGQAVRVTPVGGAAVDGRVRIVAPTVDAATRNGLVYVDLPRPGAARPGMFARGEIQLGRSEALTLPQGAVLLRDGFSWVFRVGPDGRVQQTKVQVGRRDGDRIEITSGLDAGARVVAAGGAFLADGDAVRVVAAGKP